MDREAKRTRTASQEKPSFYGHPEGPAREAHVGVSAFLAPGEQLGFDSIFKQRFTDFIVRELDQAGRPVTLREDAPLLPEQQQQQQQQQQQPQEALEDPEASASLSSLIGPDAMLSIRAMIGDPSVREVVLSAGAGDKATRGLIHQGVRRVFGPDRVNSTTRDGAVVVQRGPDKRYRSNKTSWPSSRPAYLHFVLVKLNTDTSSAIDKLCRTLGVKSRVFAWAGTKDRRAVTAQRISAHRVDAVRLEKSAIHLRDSLRVGTFSYQSEPLSMGQLSGNRFEVLLRFVRAPGGERQVLASFESLRATGFINYYGMQRFGTWSVPTHVVGIAVLRGDFQAACDLIVHNAYPGWLPNRDVRAALQALERRHHIEVAVLKALQRAPGNHQQAFNSLPRNSKTLYVHAYQAYLWNMAATRRIELFGNQVVKGDLVLTPESRRDVQGHEAAEGATRVDFSHNASVQVLTEETRANYAMSDVVMPIIGSEALRLPDHQVAAIYMELLQRDGINPESFIKESKALNAGGGFRRLVIKPGNLETEVIRYTDERRPLLQSEFEDKAPPEQNGKYLAVALRFELPPGTYATMMVREVSRRPTDSSYWREQGELWDRAKENK